MDTSNLMSLVEHLEDNIDELEENLEPLLATALTATTKKLPLLDKAKLYVLIVYSIESLLFSYLRLNGVKAKEHPVFKELTRVKQYFEKIKIAEEGPAKPRENLSLNKEAVARVIKHALAGNNKHDLERAEREAKEKLMAKRKLKALEQKEDILPAPVVEDPANSSQASSDGADEGEIEENDTAQTTLKLPTVQPGNAENTGKKDKKGKKRRASKAEKKAKKRKREQQDEGSEKIKQKKTGKRKNKRDRSPPADREEG